MLDIVFEKATMHCCQSSLAVRYRKNKLEKGLRGRSTAFLKSYVPVKLIEINLQNHRSLYTENFAGECSLLNACLNLFVWFYVCVQWPGANSLVRWASLSQVICLGSSCAACSTRRTFVRARLEEVARSWREMWIQTAPLYNINHSKIKPRQCVCPALALNLGPKSLKAPFSEVNINGTWLHLRSKGLKI